MAYMQLTIDKVGEYIKSIDEMKKVFTSFNNLDIEEIGDGNLNYVYMVTNKDKKEETVILKQAVPFLRCVGEDYPLSKDRMKIEVKALNKQYELCPNLVPKIFHASDEMCVVVMQNLNKHKVIRAEIIDGKIFPKIQEDLTYFLANTLFYTSDYFLDAKVKKELVAQYINPDLCKITEDFVLSCPFEDSPSNIYHDGLNLEEVKSFQRDASLKIEAAKMKHIFMTKAEALLHGDFHLGSFMANEDETFVIDPEFAFYGPISFDIGKAVANFFIAYISHEYHQKRLGTNSIQYRNWLFDTAKFMYTGTINKFDILWKKHIAETKPLYWDYPNGIEDACKYRDSVYKEILEDAIGFAGCVLIRRTLGIAKNKDISGIEDLTERARLDWICLNIGREFLLNRKSISSIDDAANIVEKYSNKDRL